MALESELRRSVGPSGLGEIRVLKDAIKVISSSGEVYTIAKDAVAEGIPVQSKKEVAFMLSEDETKLISVRPWSGNHIVKFVGFKKDREGNHKIDIKPAGWRKSLKTGGKYWEDDRPQFTAYFQIVSGPFEGYRLMSKLDYVFAPGTGGAAKLSARRQSWLDATENFLDQTGFNRREQDIPYSDNVLGWLEERLLKLAAKHTAMATVEEGWLNKLGPKPTGT